MSEINICIKCILHSIHLLTMKQSCLKILQVLNISHIFSVYFMTHKLNCKGKVNQSASHNMQPSLWSLHLKLTGFILVFSVPIRCPGKYLSSKRT